MRKRINVTTAPETCPNTEPTSSISVTLRRFFPAKRPAAMTRMSIAKARPRQYRNLRPIMA